MKKRFESREYWGMFIPTRYFCANILFSGIYIIFTAFFVGCHQHVNHSPPIIEIDSIISDKWTDTGETIVVNLKDPVVSPPNILIHRYNEGTTQRIEAFIIKNTTGIHEEEIVQSELISAETISIHIPIQVSVGESAEVFINGDKSLGKIKIIGPPK